MSERDKHTLSLLVENKSGVLARISGLIAAKGYNIDSLSVGATNDATVSRMTIVLRGDEWVIEQAVKQLERLIDVIVVDDLSDTPRVERELILVRIGANSDERAELCRIAEIFRAGIIDTTASCFTFELVGSRNKVDDFLDLLRPFAIYDLYRAGLVAMPRRNKKGQGVVHHPGTAAWSHSSSSGMPMEVRAELAG